MFLSELQVKGFCFFKAPATVKLHHGLNLLVGKNGCGKREPTYYIWWQFSPLGSVVRDSEHPMENFWSSFLGQSHFSSMLEKAAILPVSTVLVSIHSVSCHYFVPLDPLRNIFSNRA